MTSKLHLLRCARSLTCGKSPPCVIAPLHEQVMKMPPGATSLSARLLRAWYLAWIWQPQQQQRRYDHGLLITRKLLAGYWPDCHGKHAELEATTLHPLAYIFPGHTTAYLVVARASDALLGASFGGSSTSTSYVFPACTQHTQAMCATVSAMLLNKDRFDECVAHRCKELYSRTQDMGLPPFRVRQPLSLLRKSMSICTTLHPLVAPDRQPTAPLRASLRTCSSAFMTALMSPRTNSTLSCSPLSCAFSAASEMAGAEESTPASSGEGGASIDKRPTKNDY